MFRRLNARASRGAVRQRLVSKGARRISGRDRASRDSRIHHLECRPERFHKVREDVADSRVLKGRHRARSVNRTGRRWVREGVLHRLALRKVRLECRRSPASVPRGGRQVSKNAEGNRVTPDHRRSRRVTRGARPESPRGVGSGEPDSTGSPHRDLSRHQSIAMCQ
jgi:hypothetical protein